MMQTLQLIFVQRSLFTCMHLNLLMTNVCVDMEDLPASDMYIECAMYKAYCLPLNCCTVTGDVPVAAGGSAGRCSRAC